MGLEISDSTPPQEVIFPAGILIGRLLFMAIRVKSKHHGANPAFGLNPPSA